MTARQRRGSVVDLVRLIRDSVPIESTAVFVLLAALVGGAVSGVIGYAVDRSYRSTLAAENAQWKYQQEQLDLNYKIQVSIVWQTSKERLLFYNRGRTNIYL